MFLLTRLCITDKLNGPTSKKATVLWQSNPNYKSPFDFVDIDVTIDESHILKLQSNTLKKSKSFGELRLVWQVCTRNKDTIDDNDFELLSYSTIKYSTFRSAAKKAMVWNEANEGHKKDYLGMMHGQDDMPKQITKYFYTPKEKRERDNFGKLVKNNQDNRFGGIAHMLNDAMNLENIQHQLTDMNSKFNDAMKLENIENQISRLSVDISAGALNQINKINHLSNDALSQIHDLDLSKLDLDLNHVMDDVNDAMNKNLNDVMHGKIKLNIFNLKEDSGDGFEEELKGVCATVKVDEETGIDSTTRDTNNSVITIDDIAFDSDVEDRETPDNGYIQFSPLLVIQTHHIGPGEETFDRIVDDMLKQRIDDWLVAVKPVFSDALSDQKQTVLRSINILNAIKSGVRINPSFVVDVNPLCSMSLMQHSSVNDNSGSVKIDSNMLKALDVVYNFLYYFSNTNRIQAFAGGEVLPPTKEHPMHSCCRRVGIPLCQEYLINAEREGLLNNTFRKKRNSKAGALPHEDVAKCSTIFSMSSKSEIYNYLDKNKDLIHRMQKPVEDPESWGGGDYSTNHVVDTYDAFIGGVEEASMLYEPVNRKCDALADPGLLTASDRQAAGVGAEMVDNASDNLQRKTVKQNLDTCYAGSSEVPSGDEFWDILKKLDFISSAEFCSYDLDTVEVLLANSQKNAGKKDIPIVIWVISQPPNEEMVKRAENLFYRQCIGDFDNTKLIVLLVAEVRYDIYKYTQSDLISVGAQFDALKLAYERADNASIEHLRNIMRKRHKPSQVEREEGLNYINQRSERHNKSRDDPTKRVSGNLHVGTNDNMMLFHWISWPEVVAKAITSEKNDISTTRGHKGQSNQSNAEDADNRENSKLNHAGISQFPKLATVQKVLEELFPVYAARRIVDIDEFDSTSDEQIQNNDHRNHHDSVNTLARDSVRRDSAMGVRTSIAGFFGDGIGRRFSHGMLQMLSIKGRNDKNDEAQTDKDKAKGQKSQKALSAYRFSKYSSLRRHKLLKHIKGKWSMIYSCDKSHLYYFLQDILI